MAVKLIGKWWCDPQTSDVPSAQLGVVQSAIQMLIHTLQVLRIIIIIIISRLFLFIPSLCWTAF